MLKSRCFLVLIFRFGNYFVLEILFVIPKLTTPCLGTLFDHLGSTFFFLYFCYLLFDHIIVDQLLASVSWFDHLNSFNFDYLLSDHLLVGSVFGFAFDRVVNSFF